MQYNANVAESFKKHSAQWFKQLIQIKRTHKEPDIAFMQPASHRFPLKADFFSFLFDTHWLMFSSHFFFLICCCIFASLCTCGFFVCVSDPPTTNGRPSTPTLPAFHIPTIHTYARTFPLQITLRARTESAPTGRFWWRWPAGWSCR